MSLADFLSRKPKVRPVAEPERLPEGWAEPDTPREQTKVGTVRAAKVGRVAGPRRRR